MLQAATYRRRDLTLRQQVPRFGGSEPRDLLPQRRSPCTAAGWRSRRHIRHITTLFTSLTALPVPPTDAASPRPTAPDPARCPSAFPATPRASRPGSCSMTQAVQTVVVPCADAPPDEISPPASDWPCIKTSPQGLNGIASPATIEGRPLSRAIHQEAGCFALHAAQGDLFSLSERSHQMMQRRHDAVTPGLAVIDFRSSHP